MPKANKKIKVYIRHDVAHEIKARVNREGFFNRFFNFIFETCYATGSLLIDACYLVGLVLVYVFVRESKRPAAKIEHKIIEKKATLAQRLARLRHPYVKFGLVIFLGLIISQAAVFKSASLIAYGIDLKGRVLGSVSEGVGHLTDAQQNLQDQDVASAQAEFTRAIQSFQQSQGDIKVAGDTIDQLLKVIPQKRDADRLLSAAELASKSGLDLTNFYNEFEQFKLTPEGITGNNVSANFDNMSGYLKSGQANLQKASELLSKVDEKNVPKDAQLKVIQVKQLLGNASQALNSFAGIFDISKSILMGNKNILVIFQNNNELRPTGGFIGTYGSFVVSDGRIKSSHISSIYDLDGQLTENIAAPFPLRQVSGTWHMRDSNWFTSFPESAKKITDFYEKEGGETPDLVIAMTPTLISDLLKVTGPIDLPAYKTTLDSDNFVERTQMVTSVTYDKNLNKPKQMLADFFPLFLQRLGSLKGPESVQLLSVLQKNLLAKQIMFYSRNSELEQKFTAYNWTGGIRSTDRDYLLVSTANLSGTKTDLYIDQNIKQESAIGENGEVTNTLTITRTSHLPKAKQYDNLSFMRIYVPEGSSLISTSGFGPLPNTPAPPGNLKTDSDALAWESTAVKDVLSDTVIGKESGKTFFGNWVTTSGGGTQTIVVKYRLPFKIKSVDHYSLLLQKQPGSVNQTFDYSLLYSSRGSNWKNFTPDKDEANNFSVHYDLDKDYFLGEVISIQ